MYSQIIIAFTLASLFWGATMTNGRTLKSLVNDYFLLMKRGNGSLEIPPFVDGFLITTSMYKRYCIVAFEYRRVNSILSPATKKKQKTYRARET